MNGHSVVGGPDVTTAINRYKADLRELRFVLFEQLKLDEILGRAPFKSWGRDEVELVLTEAYRFCREVTGPLNPVGDRTGCRLENGQVMGRSPPSSVVVKKSPVKKPSSAKVTKGGLATMACQASMPRTSAGSGMI